jgi:hypothetical protein
MNRLLKIDELVRDMHAHLREGDECYYFKEFTSEQGPKYSPGNSFVYNFKKSLDKKGQPDWQYKALAIRQLGELYCESFPHVLNIEECIIIPIPPSKIKSHPLYDDRLIQTLKIFANKFPEADIREILSFRDNLRASHEGPPRPSPDEIFQNLVIDESLCQQKKAKIVLVDDVITAGAHFKACKAKILEYFPDAEVMGIFIARRILPPPSADFDDFVWFA